MYTGDARNSQIRSRSKLDKPEPFTPIDGLTFPKAAHNTPRDEPGDLLDLNFIMPAIHIDARLFVVQGGLVSPGSEKAAF